MTTLYLHTLLSKDAKCYCDDCGWKGKAKKLKPIRDIDQRLHPGEEIPAGECPNCGACAYRKPKRTAAQKILRKWYKQTSETDKVFTVSELNEIVDDLHTLLVLGTYSRPEKPAAKVPASKMFLTDDEMKAERDKNKARKKVLKHCELLGADTDAFDIDMMVSDYIFGNFDPADTSQYDRYSKEEIVLASIINGQIAQAKEQCKEYGLDFKHYSQNPK